MSIFQHNWSLYDPPETTRKIILSKEDAKKLSESQDMSDCSHEEFLPLWAIGEDGMTLQDIGTHIPIIYFKNISKYRSLATAERLMGNGVKRPL